MRTSRATILGVAATAMFWLGAGIPGRDDNRLDEANGTIAISEAQSGTV